MKGNILKISIVILVLINLSLLLKVEQQRRSILKIEGKFLTFEDSLKNAILKIEETAEKKEKEISVRFENSLAVKSEKTLNRKLNKYKEDLDRVKKEIEKEETRYKKIRENRERAEAGLPEYVSLDDLQERYKRNSKDGYGYYSANENFKTSKGTISFLAYDFEFATIPSNGKLAWMKIGKEKSILNVELIKAWLNESTETKVKQGYKLIYNKTEPTDYGECTEKNYKKGDMFFKTYYQYERVQGTYGRYSLQYNFFIEIGSYKRKNQYKLEEYNSKIGS